MKNRKTYFIFIILIITFFSFLPVLYAASELKLAHDYAPKTPYGLAGEKFAEIVAKKSNGDLKIKYYPGGQLGKATELLSSLQMGTVDMYLGSMATFGWIKGGEMFQVCSLPYLFDSIEKAHRAFNSPLFKDMYEQMEKKTGIKIYMSLGERAPRAVNTVKVPVWSPADIKGLKIRTPPNPMLVEAFKAWGANPVPIPLPELFTSLQQGIVDGQDNGIDFIEPSSLQEVTHYFAFTDHVTETLGWAISSKTWKKLSPKQQATILEATKEAGEWEINYFRKSVEESMKKLQAQGMKFTIPNKTAFAVATKDLYKKFEGQKWPEGLVGKIKSIK